MLRIKQTSASTYDQQQQYVPLKKVTVQANIRSFAADVTIKQLFRNDESTSIEAVYCFPIEEQAAVYAFIAKIDDRQIIAELKEKKQAQQEYNDALQQGHGAYLLEQDQHSPDNFIINVGALPPGKECYIEISYVTELHLVQHGTKIRFVVPTTIAPRYNPNQGDLASPAGTTANYVQVAPYTVDFRCQIDKTSVTRVSSLSHPIQVDVSHEDVYVIEFGQQNTHLDRDILIDIELADNRSNTILAVENGAVMASFTPNQQDCQRALKTNTQVTNEFIFVIDCSGSMQNENKIGFARQAMLLFLKSLPLNCHFNIIRFGSTHQTLFNDITVIYNKEHAEQAEQLTNNMQADLGGTELLVPLQWLDEHPPQQGRARQIFLLTDGEISNVDQVLDLCRAMSTSTRIFSFGLGRSPSRSLVKGLARVTNGRFVFIPPDTNVDVYVGEQLEKALQSSITNIQVKWNLGRTVTNVPSTPPPVYVNDRLVVYGLINEDNASGAFNHDSSVELFYDQHRLGEAKVNCIPHVSDNGTISRLAAKALILELQHSKLSSLENKSGSRQARFQEEREQLLNKGKEERKKRIIELSLKYSILSPHTAFVGIEKRMNANNDDMILREVPIQVSDDDQDLQRNMNVSNMCCPMTRSFDPYSKYMYQSQASLKPLHSNQFSLKPSSSQIQPYSSSCIQMQQQSYSPAPYDSAWAYMCPSTTVDYAMTSNSICSSDDEKSSHSKRQKIEEPFPSDDENIVRYLINKQMFDGCWELNSNEIEQLTGKPLSHFQQSIDTEALVTAIIVEVLETRFASFSSMWYGVVQKARQRLLDLLSNDEKKLSKLFEEIYQKLFS